MKFVKICILLIILTINICINSEINRVHKKDKKDKKTKKRNPNSFNKPLENTRSNTNMGSMSNMNHIGNMGSNNLGSGSLPAGNQQHHQNKNNDLSQINNNQNNRNANAIPSNAGLYQNNRNENLGRNNYSHENSLNNQHQPGINNQQNQPAGVNNHNNLNNNQLNNQNLNLNHKNQKDPFRPNVKAGYSPKVQPFWYNHFRWSWVYGIPNYSRRYILSHRSLCLDVCERREVMCNGSDVITEYEPTTGFLKCVCVNDQSKALVDNEYCWTPRKCILTVENIGCMPILNAIFQKKKDLGYEDEI